MMGRLVPKRLAQELSFVSSRGDGQQVAICLRCARSLLTHSYTFGTNNQIPFSKTTHAHFALNYNTHPNQNLQLTYSQALPYSTHYNFILLSSPSKTSRVLHELQHGAELLARELGRGRDARGRVRVLDVLRHL